MAAGRLIKMSAFSRSPVGGNPAGVWLGDELPSEAEMQSIAADVGFSETVFVTPTANGERLVRYFSPKAEVPFCGHATIAAGAVLGAEWGAGTYVFHTRAGAVPVAVEGGPDGPRVSLTSVEPRQRELESALLERALELLGWFPDEVDPALPPALAYAGAWHLVIAASTAERLARLNYDFTQLADLMSTADLTTLQLVWREKIDRFHARNPFPVGGVVEDPATGAAAAALGGYLRSAKLISAPSTFSIRQGEVMGRPSDLTVHVPESGGIIVTGHAVRLSD